MKLKVHKDLIDDPSFIEVEDLLKKFVQNIPKQDPGISIQDVDREIEKAVTKLRNLSIFLTKGIFNLASPVNISCNNDIEKDTSLPIGSLYYDNINDLLRLKGRKGWRTI